jgi:hypothetical protein
VTDAETALEAAKAALEETQTALDEVTVELTFQALPRRAFEKLISENPPTDEARKEGEQYNVDTFVPALIAACSVDGLTLEDVERLIEQWNVAEVGSVFALCRTVNETARVSLGAT